MPALEERERRGVRRRVDGVNDLTAPHVSETTTTTRNSPMKRPNAHKRSDDAAGYHLITGTWTIEVFWGPDYGFGAGWYWWPCMPGCLPDGDETGPFPRSIDARDDASDV